MLLILLLCIYRMLQLSRDYCTKREVFRTYLADNPLHMHTLANMEVINNICLNMHYILTYSFLVTNILMTVLNTVFIRFIPEGVCCSQWMFVDC